MRKLILILVGAICAPALLPGADIFATLLRYSPPIEGELHVIAAADNSWYTGTVLNSWEVYNDDGSYHYYTSYQFNVPDTSLVSTSPFINGKVSYYLAASMSYSDWVEAYDNAPTLDASSSFPHSSLPAINTPPDPSNDRVFDGSLDVQGNRLNLGSQWDYSPGAQWKFELTPYSAYLHSIGNSLVFQWTWQSLNNWNETTSSFQPGVVMALSGSGNLYLRNTVDNSSISFQPGQGIYMYPVGWVATQNYVSSYAMQKSPTSVNIGSGRFQIDTLGDVKFGNQTNHAIRIDSSTQGGGRDLTIQAGSAATGAADSIGGGLTLSTGASTGYAGSFMDFRTAARGETGNLQNAAISRMFINSDGAVGIGVGAHTGFDGVRAKGGLDIAYGGNPATLMLGADHNSVERGDGTDKRMAIAMPGWDETSLPVTVVSGFSTDTMSALAFGVGEIDVRAAANHLEFYTAESTNTAPGTVRMTIDPKGNIVAGTETFAAPGSSSQVVIGKHNLPKAGVFVVGGGTSAQSPRNAVRITDSGTLLVHESGDLSMGDFKSGEQP